MKKIFVLGMALLMVVGFSAAAMAGIAGTDHDFSTESWNDEGEICNVCHTPHNAKTGVGGAPLWNHEVTQENFTVYNSPTLDAGSLGQPQGTSKLCLSCHDGTLGVDAYGGSPTNTEMLTGDEKVGPDLSNDHPISFTYDSQLASDDGGLWDPSNTNSGLGGTITADMLFVQQLECASCHDVHDDTKGDFLRLANTASALCLTCHNK